ncbi:MAG: hypothetical protein II152_05480 [Succinivibrionaceae bacterium]|nr:hypothetical protein [Succinivibrionaceae bacterium]
MAEDTINVREPDPQLSQQDSAPKAEKKVQPEQAQKIDDEMDQRVKDFHRRFDDLVNDAAAGKKGLFSSPDRNAKRLQEDLAKLIKDIQNRQAKDAEESRKAVEAREQLLKKKAKADDFFKTEKAKIDAIAMEMQTKIQKMYDDLDKRRTEVLQAPDEDKKGLIDRFSGWMKNIYRNNVNELRKILGLPVKDEKKEQEAQKTAAETVVNQQSQPRTQSQTGQDGPAKTQDPQQIIDLLRHELDKQKELNAQLQQRIDDQDKKIKELESKLQKAQPQAENEPQKTEPKAKPVQPEPKAEVPQQTPEPESVDQNLQTAGQPEKKQPAPQDKDQEQQNEPYFLRYDFDRSSPITGERMACLAPRYGYDDQDKKLAVETKKPVSPEDFVRAFIYTSLKYNHHSDLSRIIKNATEAFRLSLDSSSVAAPWVTESGKEVIAFNGFDFLCGRFKQRDDDYWALKDRLGMDVKADNQALKDRLGMNEGQFKDFIETAESMDDILHERFGGLKLDINEYRQMVISAAKEEIAAKGLDKKEFDKILNEARKAPEMAVRKLVTDFYQANPYKQTGGLITEDGGFRTWKEHESIEGMTKRMDKNIEQEQKNKGNVSLRG